jgi:hypothetical protein
MSDEMKGFEDSNAFSDVGQLTGSSCQNAKQLALCLFTSKIAIYCYTV